MKTFLSIGTGPGMGLANAERFAREGYCVVLSARSLDKVKALAQDLQSKGFTAEARSADAGNAASIASLVQGVLKDHGVIDVLHYNAAAIHKDTVLSQAPETFNSDLGVNIGGALSAIHTVLPTMTQNANGSILLTGGGFGLHPHPDYLSLSIGKAGIRTIALGLFESLKEKGIHVATVTVAAFVDPGSKAATTVADKFWQLHAQPKTSWTAEDSYSE